MRKALSVASLAIALTLLGSGIAFAAHQFTDVPDGHVFHSDISWLADHGITKGCNPPGNDEYCPDDAVTRGQMAAFLHRFGDIDISTTIAIDQFGFTPVRDNHTFLDYDYQAAGNLGRYSTDILGASVPVPDGATITGLSATFCDSTSMDDYVARLLRRPDPAVSAPAEVLAEVSSSGADCAMTVSTTSINDPEVDTSAYSYAILITSATGNVNIRRATVTYDMPLVP
ncbi:MAG: S-layer homology domain-containing protein [Acidimicrobiia bacterium]